MSRACFSFLSCSFLGINPLLPQPDHFRKCVDIGHDHFSEKPKLFGFIHCKRVFIMNGIIPSKPNMMGKVPKLFCQQTLVDELLQARSQKSFYFWKPNLQPHIKSLTVHSARSISMLLKNTLGLKVIVLNILRHMIWKIRLVWSWIETPQMYSIKSLSDGNSRKSTFWVSAHQEPRRGISVIDRIKEIKFALYLKSRILCSTMRAIVRKSCHV